MKIAAIVVTFNRVHQLQTTVARLLDEDVDHVLVVNNASTDGTQAWLAHQSDPRLHVVTLPDNTGGAGGFEAGMAAARDLYDPDWMVLMDDDARPCAGAIAQFRAASDRFDPTPGAVAAAVFYPDGTLCEMNRPSRNPFWNAKLFVKTLFNGNREGFHLDDDAFAVDAAPRAIDVASFVGFFVHKDAVADVGLPEGGLFIYGDDVLYSLRLRRAGFDMIFAPNVPFEHDCSTTGEGFTYRPLWKIYYHCRNGVSIARQAAGPIVFPFALVYYILIWWRRGRFYTDAERRQYRKLMWMGLRDGLRGHRGRKDDVHNIPTPPA